MENHVAAEQDITPKELEALEAILAVIFVPDQEGGPPLTEAGDKRIKEVGEETIRRLLSEFSYREKWIRKLPLEGVWKT